MKIVTTELTATVVAPNTWWSIRDQMFWKMRLEAPLTKKATYAA
jgi:hypothetical protein